MHKSGEKHADLMHMCLEAIFARPTRADIPWSDIEGVFGAPGATVQQGRGSRVHVELNAVAAVFHEPHPRRETSKGFVASVRDLPTAAELVP